MAKRENAANCTRRPHFLGQRAGFIYQAGPVLHPALWLLRAFFKKRERLALFIYFS